MTETFVSMDNERVPRKLTIELMREMRRILYLETGGCPTSIRAGKPVLDAYARIFSARAHLPVSFSAHAWDGVTILRDDGIPAGEMLWCMGSDPVGSISDIDVSLPVNVCSTVAMGQVESATIEKIEVRSADPDAIIFGLAKEFAKKSEPADPLDRVIDGVSLRDLLAVDQATRREDSLTITSERQLSQGYKARLVMLLKRRNWTEAQRDAVSVYWSAQLREKVGSKP